MKHILHQEQQHQLGLELSKVCLSLYINLDVYHRNMLSNPSNSEFEYLEVNKINYCEILLMINLLLDLYFLNLIGILKVLYYLFIKEFKFKIMDSRYHLLLEDQQ